MCGYQARGTEHEVIRQVQDHGERAAFLERYVPEPFRPLDSAR